MDEALEKKQILQERYELELTKKLEENKNQLNQIHIILAVLRRLPDMFHGHQAPISRSHGYIS